MCTTLEIFQKLVYKVVTGCHFNINNISQVSKNMSYVKRTQHEDVDPSSKINSFAELCFEMNVQINMQDPETPPFNCQGRNHVAGNCVQNRLLVPSEVLVFQFWLI